MESEESLLRPCKSLPPPPKEHDALQIRISPHFGSASSTGEMVQGFNTPTKEIDGGYVAREEGAMTQEDENTVPQMGKEPEQAVTVRKEGPLNLLDLPLDVLKDIFKEVSAKNMSQYS